MDYFGGRNVLNPVITLYFMFHTSKIFTILLGKLQHGLTCNFFSNHFNIDQVIELQTFFNWTTTWSKLIQVVKNRCIRNHGMQNGRCEAK